MKVKSYFDKLNVSNEYKEFKQKYNDSFMIAGFFVLDLEKGANVNQLDFYVPKEKKIAAFTLDKKEIKYQLLEMMKGDIPEEISFDANTDLEALEGILEDEMKNRNMTESVKKIIAVLQKVDGKTIWNLNCILSGMEILKAHVDDASQTVLKMEKLSLMDIVKKVPAGMLPASMQKKGQEKNLSKQDLEKEMKNLDKLESAIEKEKKKLKEELDKKQDSKPSNKVSKSKKN